MQQLHKHLSLSIPIKDHLQIGSHGQEFVHGFFLDIQAHERHEAEEVGVVSKSQVCPHTIPGNSRLSISLYTLPE